MDHQIKSAWKKTSISTVNMHLHEAWIGIVRLIHLYTTSIKQSSLVPIKRLKCWFWRYIM